MPPEKLTLLQLALFMGADCQLISRTENLEFDTIINPDLLSRYEKREAEEKLFIKPKLRPISDMTEQEAIEIAKLEFLLGCPVHIAEAMSAHRNAFGNWFVKFNEHIHDYMLIQNMNEPFFRYNQDQTLYLMRKHFDLFGWIKKELALDKTKLKTETEK